MDNWMLWDIMARQKAQELERRRVLPVLEPRPRRPGLRQRLAALLVAAGLRLDAEASRAVLSPLQNHS